MKNGFKNYPRELTIFYTEEEGEIWPDNGEDDNLLTHNTQLIFEAAGISGISCRCAQGTIMTHRAESNYSYIAHYYLEKNLTPEEHVTNISIYGGSTLCYRLGETFILPRLDRDADFAGALQFLNLKRQMIKMLAKNSR
jgi:hypothetical protein